MESNEQNELIGKIEADSQIGNRLTAVREEGGAGLGEKQDGIKKKKNQRYQQQRGDYQRQRGWVDVEEGEGW